MEYSSLVRKDLDDGGTTSNGGLGEIQIGKVKVNRDSKCIKRTVHRFDCHILEAFEGTSDEILRDVIEQALCKLDAVGHISPRISLAHDKGRQKY